MLINELNERETIKYEYTPLIVAYAIFCLWYRAFYWMRVFERPAFFILLIKRTFFGIIPFMILLFIILGMFTNMLFVFNKSYIFNLYDPESLYPNDSDNGFYNAFVHVYLIALGDFSTDDYGNRGEYQK